MQFLPKYLHIFFKQGLNIKFEYLGQSKEVSGLPILVNAGLFSKSPKYSEISLPSYWINKRLMIKQGQSVLGKKHNKANYFALSILSPMTPCSRQVWG